MNIFSVQKMKDSRGFTLVEVMVALLIAGIMMTLVMRFVFAQMQGYKKQQMISDTQQNLRTVMDSMERDIRMAGAGIPKVAISTGQTSLPNNVIYPLYIIQGTIPQTTANQMFQIASAAANVNDSIIIIYQDPDRPLANAVLAQDMPTPASPIILQTPDTSNQGFTPNQNIAFIIADNAGTKADLFMMSTIANNGTVTLSGNQMYNNTATGHQINYLDASSAGAAFLGYRAGNKVVAVKVIRYDFSPDVPNFPITKLVDNDTIRATDNAIGEFFGNAITTQGISAANNANMAMDIQYSPYLGTGASTLFYQGMPAAPYNIGTVKITLTARTSVKGVNFANTLLMSSRSMTTDIQPRGYNGN